MLAQAIVREGAKAVAAGLNPMDLKRGIDKAVAVVVEELEKNTKMRIPRDRGRGFHGIVGVKSTGRRAAIPRDRGHLGQVA